MGSCLCVCIRFSSMCCVLACVYACDLACMRARARVRARVCVHVYVLSCVRACVRVVPQLKAPALPLWGHIPRLKRALDQPATGSQRIHYRNARRAHKQFAASQSFNGPKPSNVRPSIIVAARPRMTGIEPSSDRHGSCSLNRYTTLKIAGAAHKLSVNESRFEHTFGRCQVLVTN